MPADQRLSAPAEPRVRWFASCLWLGLFGLLACNFFEYARYAAAAIRYPFELNYGEGIVWQQAKLMLTGRMYGDIDTYPYIVFHYPPLYHLFVRTLSAAGASPLSAGRSISVVSTVVVAVFAGMLAFAGSGFASKRARLIAAGVTSLLIFTWVPLFAWSILMRVDMLALALGYGGLVLCLLAVRAPHLLTLAVLFFLAAGFTKQTAIAPPASALCVWLLYDARATIKAFGTGLLIGVAALVALEWTTHGGFLRHILLYNLNRFDLGVALYQIRVWGTAYGLYVVALVGAVATTSRRIGLRTSVSLVHSGARTAEARSGFFTVLFSVYLLIATAMLGLSGKTGAGPNYLMEWMCVATVWIGVLCARSIGSVFAIRPQGRRIDPALAGLFVPLLLIGQATALPDLIASARMQILDTKVAASKQALLDRFSSATKPVLSDDMVLTMRSGKDIPLEPAIFAELASKGLWDEAKLLGLLDGRAFAFVLTAGGPDDQIFRDRYLPATRDAILRDYPHVENFGEYRLRSP